MKLLVRLTDSEYGAFRRYTSEVMGFDDKSRRKGMSSDFRGREAEDWLLQTGKIELKERPIDSRGRKYRDAYLVIRGTEENCMAIYRSLYTMEVYEDHIWRKSKTILRNMNLENRLIREF